MRVACIVLSLLLVAACAEARSCPPGWTSITSVTSNGTQRQQRCVQLQLMQLSAIDTELVCEHVLSLGSSSNTADVAKSFSVRSQSDNEVALAVASPAFAIGTPVLLGGAAGLGSLVWYDGSAPLFASFTAADNTSLQSTSGCLALRRDGSWALVSCVDTRGAFICAFDLSDATAAPATPAPTTNAPSAPPPTSPQYLVPPRPPAPMPRPPCPSGWVLLNTSGKCYQYVEPLSFGALDQQTAQSYCTSQYPQASLTSVLSPDEASFVGSLVSQRPQYPLAFVGGVFMNSGAVGVWYEDNMWYPNTSAWGVSSPSWPTATNNWYRNWDDAEPSLAFGCVAVGRRGRWVSQSCQSRLPFICSFINDGSTTPLPTSTPTSQTPIPTFLPTVAPPADLVCPPLWSPLPQISQCFRLVSRSQVAASDYEAACNQLTPASERIQVLAHAAAPMTDVVNDFIASLISSARLSAALIGVSFVTNGTDGMCLDGATEYNAAFALSHFGANEPRRQGGCVQMRSDGRWAYTPCSVGQSAFVCAYPMLPAVGATTVAPTSTPSAAPLPPSRRIASINYGTYFAVARRTTGNYTVQSAGGDIEGLLLLFSPDSSCSGSNRGDLISIVVGGTIVVTHPIAFRNGTVCVSADGQLFTPTPVTMDVLDVSITGVLVLNQNLYVPPSRRSAYDDSAIIRALSMTRGTSSIVQLAGRGAIEQLIATARFASSPSCNNNLYTLSDLDMPVYNSIFSARSFVQPQAPQTQDPLLDDTTFAPPDAYYLCVAVTGSSASSPPVYTRVANVTARLNPEFVAVTSLFIVDPTGVAGIPLSQAAVPQFSSPRIGLVGEGVRSGMQVLFSYDPLSCARRQSPPTFSLLDDQLPPFAVTVAPIGFTFVDSDANASTPAVMSPYVQLTLNQTAMYGVDLLVSAQELYLCIALSATEPFYATMLSIRVNRQVIQAVTQDGDAPVGPALVVNTGFAGLLRLWGVDASLWSLETLSTTQVGFAEAPGGSEPIGPLVNQCRNISRFYNLRALSVVGSSSNLTSADDLVRHGNLSSNLFVVIPPKFFVRQTSRRMRLCLSVPHLYDSLQRRFVPTQATIDVQPVQLLFLGRFGAASLGSGALSTVAIPENSDNVVLPLSGYGIRADMQLFLSREPCLSQAEFQDAFYISRVSQMNISISSAYDVPLAFRDKSGTPMTAGAYKGFAVLTKAQHTNVDTANAIFGKKRSPLFVCLWAPQTRNLVFPTFFQLTVTRPSIQSIVDATGTSPAVVDYGSYADLVITGYGLNSFTQFVPALNCANQSTFLWRAPVQVSPVPSLLLQHGAPPVMRFADYETMNSSWFLPLNQQQTARIGSVMPVDNVLRRFQWCVNYDVTDPHYTFEPAGVLYVLRIPAVDGVASDVTAAPQKALYVMQERSALGHWSKAFFSGPLIASATKTGNPMYMFLTEPRLSCAKLKNFIVASNSSDRFVVAIDGAAVLLPAHVSAVGTFKVCASVLYPPQRSTDAVEAALQFIELTNITIVVQAPVFRLFTINGTSTATLEQGAGPLMTIDGLGLSLRSRLRLMPSAAAASGTPCGSTSMPGGLGDIVVRPVLPGMTINRALGARFFIHIDHEESRLIPTGLYSLCFLPNPAEPWQLSSLRLNVVGHIRKPSVYNYFSTSAAGDLVTLVATFPTKLALSTSTMESNVVNIVGTVGREVSVQLLCRNVSGATEACGDNKRIMFVRPLDGDADPCFIDDEDDDWENMRGPFVMRSSIVTLPRLVTNQYTYVPSFEDPWVMCVETSADVWRRPNAPRVVLQFTSIVVTGIRWTPDTPSNSSAYFPVAGAATLPNNGARNAVVYAGDVTQVLYLNGFGIQTGIWLRFGLGCAGNATSQLPNNAVLLERPLQVGSDDGAFLLPSHYFLVPESAPLPLCVSQDGKVFVQTNVTLDVRPTRIVHDATESLYTDHRLIAQAFSDTALVPRYSRGLVDLSLLRTKDGATVALGDGGVVMLSTTCLYNSNGLPLLQLQNESYISVSYKHTSIPTLTTLRVCVRRARALRDNNGTLQYSYASSVFLDTRLSFKVVNVSLQSISVHPRVAGVEVQHDITNILFNHRGRDLLVPLAFAFQPNEAASAFGDDTTILDSFDDANLLSFFELAVFRIGRPCHVPAVTAAPAKVTTLSSHTARFANGRATVTPDGLEGFQVPLRIDDDFVADPWNPFSMCFSVDGGRHYLSVGVAFFTATWAPTLFAFSDADGASPAFTQQLSVFESSSLYVPFTDSRYDSRILANTSPGFKDNELSRLLNHFTVSALWAGFVGGNGYASENVLYLPAQIVLDGENVSAYLKSTTPTTAPHELLFTYDQAAQDIDTGITISIAPMTIKCLEGSLTNVFVNKEEPGRSFSLPLTGPCNVGVNAGAVLRLVSGASCSAARTSFVADTVIDSTYSLVLPAQLPYVSSGVFLLCLRKYLPLRFAAEMGVESEYLATGVSLHVTRRLLVDQIGGISSGVLTGFFNDVFSVPVTGAGVGTSSSIILSLVPSNISGVFNTSADDACNRVAGYVDAAGNPLSADPLMDWFPLAAGVWTIPAESNRPPAGVAYARRSYLVCVSVDFGLSFQAAGNGIFYTLVPPTVFGVHPTLSTGAQLYDASSTPSVVQLLRVPMTATTIAAVPLAVRRGDGVLDYFIRDTSLIRLIGNGIGARSRRKSPLVVSIVDSSIVGSVCNGALPPAAVTRSFFVDSQLGTILDNITSVVVDRATPYQRYLVCTSSDDGATYYSGNSVVTTMAEWTANKGAVSRAPWVERLEQYAAMPVVLQVQPDLKPTVSSSDLRLEFHVIVAPGLLRLLTEAPTITLSMLQWAMAASIEYPPGSLALTVLPHGTVEVASRTCFLYHVVVRALTGSVNSSTRLVGSVEAVYVALWKSVSQNGSTVMQSMVGGAAPADLSVAALHMSVRYDAGTAVSSQAPQNVAADSASFSTLAAAPSPLINSNRFADLSDDDLDPKATWSVVPLIMVMPFFMFFGTYQIYLRYFDIITPEELAARNKIDEQNMQLSRERRTMALRGSRNLVESFVEAGQELRHTATAASSEIQSSMKTAGEELRVLGSNILSIGHAVAGAATSAASSVQQTVNSLTQVSET